MLQPSPWMYGQLSVCYRSRGDDQHNTHNPSISTRVSGKIVFRRRSTHRCPSQYYDAATIAMDVWATFCLLSLSRRRSTQHPQPVHFNKSVRENSLQKTINTPVPISILRCCNHRHGCMGNFLFVIALAATINTTPTTRPFQQECQGK